MNMQDLKLKLTKQQKNDTKLQNPFCYFVCRSVFFLCWKLSWLEGGGKKNEPPPLNSNKVACAASQNQMTQPDQGLLSLNGSLWILDSNRANGFFPLLDQADLSVVGLQGHCRNSHKQAQILKFKLFADISLLQWKLDMLLLMNFNFLAIVVADFINIFSIPSFTMWAALQENGPLNIRATWQQKRTFGHMRHASV